MVWRVKNQRARFQHVRLRTRIVLGVRRNFREGHITGRVDKLPKLAVRYWRSIDPECANGHAMCGRLFRIVLVRAHSERPAWNEHHVGAIAYNRQGRVGLSSSFGLRHRRGTPFDIVQYPQGVAGCVRKIIVQPQGLCSSSQSYLNAVGRVPTTILPYRQWLAERPIAPKSGLSTAVADIRVGSIVLKRQRSGAMAN